MESKKIGMKWWYRLLKVIFIFGIILSIIICFLIALENKPRINYLESTYSYKCNDGLVGGNLKHYLTGGEIETDVFTGALTVKKPTDANFLSTICSDTEQFKLLKSTDSGWEELSKKASVHTFEQNYTIIFKDKILTGSWEALGGALILSLFLLSVFWGFIRFLFFYIVLGVKKFIFNEVKHKSELIGYIIIITLIAFGLLFSEQINSLITKNI